MAGRLLLALIVMSAYVSGACVVMDKPHWAAAAVIVTVAALVVLKTMFTIARREMEAEYDVNYVWIAIAQHMESGIRTGNPFVIATGYSEEEVRDKVVSRFKKLGWSYDHAATFYGRGDASYSVNYQKISSWYGLTTAFDSIPDLTVLSYNL